MSAPLRKLSLCKFQISNAQQSEESEQPKKKSKKSAKAEEVDDESFYKFFYIFSQVLNPSYWIYKLGECFKKSKNKKKENKKKEGELLDEHQKNN